MCQRAKGQLLFEWGQGGGRKTWTPGQKLHQLIFQKCLLCSMQLQKESWEWIITTTKNFYVFQKVGHISGNTLKLNGASLQGRRFPMSSIFKVWPTGQQPLPRAPPWTCWIWICILTKPLGDTYGHENLRSAGMLSLSLAHMVCSSAFSSGLGLLIG